MSTVKILKLMQEAGLPNFMNVQDISQITTVSVQTLHNWSKTDKETQLRYLILGVKHEIEMRKDKIVTYKKGKNGNNIDGEATA